MHVDSDEREYLGRSAKAYRKPLLFCSKELGSMAGNSKSGQKTGDSLLLPHFSGGRSRLSPV